MVRDDVSWAFSLHGLDCPAIWAWATETSHDYLSFWWTRSVGDLLIRCIHGPGTTDFRPLQYYR